MLNTFSEIVIESVASHKRDYIFQKAASVAVGDMRDPFSWSLHARKQENNRMKTEIDRKNKMNADFFW